VSVVLCGARQYGDTTQRYSLLGLVARYLASGISVQDQIM